MRGRKILAEFIIVDNDFLSYMTIEAVKYNPTAMDSIFIPGTTVVVTSTIYEEATFGAATNEYSAFRKTWLDRNIASGKVILQLTPEYPSGVDDMGELSMIAVGTLVFNGQSVTYVSNDNFFTQMGGYGFNLVNLIPGQTHNTGQGLLYKSLLEGGMSLIEYQVSSFNLFDESSEEPIFTEGGSAIGSNGTILFLTPAGLVIRQANGDETYLSPAERFRINSDGNVEVLGIFNPTDGSVIPPDDYCFLAGTPILLTNRQSKPVESIIPGDLVQSYDASGRLVPGRVTRTFRNEVSHILDVHGLKVTPGHATLCGDGLFKGCHVPIIDILLSDGALVRADGTLMRMAINAPVGSVADAFVKVAYALTPEDVQTNNLTEGTMRVGTLLFDRDGAPVLVLDCLQAEGYAFDADTGLVAKPGEAPHPLFWFGKLPRPEDYILTRSQETLEGILTDGEWEGSRSELIDGRLRQARTMRVN
jgi:hypothetical protein